MNGIEKHDKGYSINEFVNVMGSDKVLLCTKKDYFFRQYRKIALVRKSGNIDLDYFHTYLLVRLFNEMVKL